MVSVKDKVMQIGVSRAQEPRSWALESQQIVIKCCHLLQCNLNLDVLPFPHGAAVGGGGDGSNFKNHHRRCYKI